MIWTKFLKMELEGILPASSGARLEGEGLEQVRGGEEGGGTRPREQGEKKQQESGGEKRYTVIKEEACF